MVAINPESAPVVESEPVVEHGQAYKEALVVARNGLEQPLHLQDDLALDLVKKLWAKGQGGELYKELKHGKKSQHDHYNIKIKPRDNAKADQVKKVEVDAETGAILEIKDVKAKSSD